MSIQDHIQAASERNTALLHILSETDHAKPSLYSQKAYISDLEQQLSAITKRLSDLDKRRERDLKDHVKYRDSVFRRFAYKASGKRERFEEKAQKEEKEYFEGMQESQVKSDTKKQLESLLSEANRQCRQLEEESQRHDTAQRELDGLYNSIFNGPNPNASFPEEDRLERESNDALGQYHQMRQYLESEKRALDLLKGSQREMNLALRHLSSALSYSTWDMWGGGTMVDMMERNELSSAQKQYSAVLTLHREAQYTSSNVGPLPMVKVAMGNIMSDVFFDNIFTDMAFHEKIKQSDMECRRAAGVLNSEIEKAQTRVNDGLREMNQKATRLEESRVALQHRRTEIFRSIAQQM